MLELYGIVAVRLITPVFTSVFSFIENTWRKQCNEIQYNKRFLNMIHKKIFLNIIQHKGFTI